MKRSTLFVLSIILQFIYAFYNYLTSEALIMFIARHIDDIEGMNCDKFEKELKEILSEKLGFNS